MLCDLDNAALEITAAACPGAAGIMTESLDVTDDAKVAGLLTRAHERFGRIDVIVTAAGIARSGWLDEMAPELWRRIVEVNLFGTYSFARPGGELLAENGGAFVALASDAGLRGAGKYTAYSASKHAVVGLVRSMALEYGHRGVRANAVCPSFVETPMAEALLKDVSEAQRQAYRDGNPTGRFARPEEVASAIAALVSPAMSYVNGTALSVDGGLTAGSYPGKRNMEQV